MRRHEARKEIDSTVNKLTKNNANKLTNLFLTSVIRELADWNNSDNYERLQPKTVAYALVKHHLGIDNPWGEISIRSNHKGIGVVIDAAAKKAAAKYTQAVLTKLGVFPKPFTAKVAKGLKKELQEMYDEILADTVHKNARVMVEALAIKNAESILEKVMKELVIKDKPLTAVEKEAVRAALSDKEEDEETMVEKDQEVFEDA